jgi:sterol desaturase/sphingolipid hydroxylase (fatty acid hydroxylase superfamily)
MPNEASIGALYQRADILTEVSISLVLLVFTLLIALGGERMAARYLGEARPPVPAHTWFNIRYSLVSTVLSSMFQPMVASISLALTRMLGAGWIAFPSGGWGWCMAFVSALVMTDAIEYLFHRAQHRFSLLWKMHELHHSAEHFDVTVTYRNFWIEPLIKTACLYPLVGVLFKIPPGVGAAVAMAFMLNNHVVHMNLKFASKRHTLIFNNPQYHRMHHSRDPRDYDRNFGAMLLIWDYLFGTLQRPARDQFPDVGLDSGNAPRILCHAFFWPWCRGRQGAQAIASPQES